MSLAKKALEQVNARLVVEGFRRVSGVATFHRQVAYGWHGIQVPYTCDENNHPTFRFIASVRIDALERVIVRYSPEYYSDGPNRSTLAKFAQKVCTVYSPQETAKISSWVTEAWEAHAHRFFLRYSDESAVCHDLVALPSVNDWFDFPADHERAKRVLGLAMLRGKYDDLREIAVQQKEWVAAQPGGVVTEFTSFADLLLSDLGNRVVISGT